MRWLEGRALSYGSHLSFCPFLEILRGALGILDDESDQSASEKLKHLIASSFPKTCRDPALPLDAPVAARPPDLEHRVAYLDGHATGLQVFRSVLLLFERLAREHPLRSCSKTFIGPINRRASSSSISWRRRLRCPCC